MEERVIYQPLDSWDPLNGVEKIENVIESDMYDLLNVEDTDTAQKKLDMFATALNLNKDARPRVYIIKNTGLFDRNKFSIKQKECPICLKRGETVLVNAPNKSFTTSCPKCDASISFFVPLPLQRLICDMNAPITNMIGGFGSGKTTADMYSAVKTAMNIDRSHILIGVGSGKLLQQAQGELKYFFARPWVETKGKKGDFVQMSNSNGGTWTLKNGSTFRFIAASDSGGSPEDMRSWNFNHAIVVEATNENYFRGGETSYFSELLARMRSDAGDILHYNENGEELNVLTEDGEAGPFRHGTLNKLMLESNPSPSELVPQVFNKSAVLIMTENVANKEKVIERFIKRFDPKYIDMGIVSIMSSSRDNPNLSEDFLKMKFAGRSQAYIRRMRDADMSASEKQVYSEALDYAMDPLSKEEYRNADNIYHIFDPGGNDPSGIMYAAFWKNWKKTGKPKVRIFKAMATEGGASYKGNTLGEWVDLFDTIETQYGFTTRDYVNNKTSMNWMRNDGKKGRIVRIADHNIWKKEISKDVNVQKNITDQDRLKKLGYNFKSAIKGQKSIAWGVTLVKTYFSEGMIEWDISEERLEEDFIGFLYKEDNNGENVLPQEGKHTHLMDCLRYLIVEIDVELAKAGKAPQVVSSIASRMRANNQKSDLSRTTRIQEQIANEITNDFMTRDQMLNHNNQGKRRTQRRAKQNTQSNNDFDLNFMI